MQNFPELEKKILQFWKKNKVFKKSIEARQGSSQFIFYEGPPTANGKPGLHHIVARAFKDIIARYKTMQGFCVARKAGWDTHGLPVELEVEKELGLKSKKDIEKYGITEFNKECKGSVWKYKKLWEEMTERIGYWLDLENPYITYEPEYIETVWQIIKQIWQKGLLYQGYKVVPYCARCGTSLSSHEVAQGYKKVKEPAIFVKFKIQNSKFDTYLLSWTTTPWTLPGNVALAVHPELDYVKIKTGREELILAKARAQEIGVEGEVVEKFKGKDLVGLKYEPLFDVKALQTETSHQVYAADFVSEGEGTGIVHTAVMYGVDDFELGKKYDLPQKHTVDKDGKFNSLVKDFEGRYVKAGQTEKAIIDYLENSNQLFGQDLYEHDYPFCWRCKSPLLYYAKETWFIKMTEVKDQLIKNNQEINWVPEHLKEGRFGEWLREVKDWALSRERYWGTPLPIWQCQEQENIKAKKQENKKVCGCIRVVGSIGELEELSGKKVEDVHRPDIDEVVFPCEKCGGVMKRVPEVIDCWFDSGAMPFAQGHWPFEKSKKAKKQESKKVGPPEMFPADYICEAIDQTRGWFYTLLAISTLLGFGPAYKNVISLGHVLDEKGEKMSKSKGNVIDPWLVLNKYGADAARWFFFTVNQPGDSKRVALKDIETTLRKFLMTFWNCYSFFGTYVPKKKISSYGAGKFQASGNILDRWILSRLTSLIEIVTEKLDQYDVTNAARFIDNFVFYDLSLWYVRRSRKRFQRPESQRELEDASRVLGFVLLNLSKLTAPFIPFLSENIYQNLVGRGSVHLDDWPKPDISLKDSSLSVQMTLIRKIVKMGLKVRAETGIRVRQPIASLKIKNQKSKIKNDLLDLIKDELNVKEIEVVESVRKIKDWVVEREGGLVVGLNTKLTPELLEEGLVREVVRHIQILRKKAGLTPKDKIVVQYSGSPSLSKIVGKNKKMILEETKSKDLEEIGEPEEAMRPENKIVIDGEDFYLKIIKL